MPIRVRVSNRVLDTTCIASQDDDKWWTIEATPEDIPDFEELEALRWVLELGQQGLGSLLPMTQVKREGDVRNAQWCGRIQCSEGLL